MENSYGQTEKKNQNTISKKTILFGYLAFIAILGAVLYESQWWENFSEIGLAVFLAFYFVSTALAFWLLRTNKTNSLWADAWKRLFQNKLAVFGLMVLWLTVLFVAVGPSVIYWTTGFTYDFIPPTGDLVKSFPPSFQHPMGTDEQGRDLLARVLQGGRISLAVGLISTVVSLLIGVYYGAIAGYSGG